MPLDRLASTSLPANLPFTTSGTTGRPVTWWRSRDQVLAEAAMLVDTLALREVDQVLTYAPGSHLYGFLFGSVIPALLRVPVRTVDINAPLPVSGGHPLLVTLPASWWHLGHSDRAAAAYERVTAVHSSAYLPPTAAPVVEAHPGWSLTEIHGSTETGMIGTRAHGAGAHGAGAHGAGAHGTRAAWHLAGDVRFSDEVATGTECLPRIRSPRLGWRGSGQRPREMVLGDRVQVRGPRTYRLIGRDSRLVKINGRRLDLSWVETRLRAELPGLEVRCEPVRDQIRGEWYEVVAGGGDPGTVAEVCRGVLAPWESPRAVRSGEVTGNER